MKITFIVLYLCLVGLTGCKQPPISKAIFHVTVTSVEDVEKVAGRDAVNAVLVFDDPIPNQQASLSVVFNSKETRIGLWPIGTDKATQRLLAQWSPSQTKIQPTDLEGVDGMVIYP